MELSRLKAQGEAADPEEAAVLLGELLEKDRVSEGALKERLGGLEVRLETVQKKLGQGLEREKAKADVSRLKKELAEKEPKLVPLRLEQEAAEKEAPRRDQLAAQIAVEKQQLDSYGQLEALLKTRAEKEIRRKTEGADLEKLRKRQQDWTARLSEGKAELQTLSGAEGQGGSGKPAPGAECEKRGAFGAFPEPAGHGAAGSRLQGGGEKISGCGGGKRPAAKGAFKAGTDLL